MSNLPVGAIVFEDVSKRYRLGTLGTLRSTVAALSGRRSGDAARDLWALKDISFCVEPGDSLGLIGPNGAGKTTALKLLSNITRPTSGRIEVGGRMSSLIELGAGFHPELSGRDNIFLNGAILGLKRQEIQRKLEAIIAFSDLERFIDTPVKRYSSGMYVRLGFAVAAHVEPDVLLVDEVLAVGDASFRHRCLQRMREMQASGTTVLFVSHNLHLVRDMCQRALLLIRGHLAGCGSTSSVITEYERLIVSTEINQSDSGGGGDTSGFSSPTLVLACVNVLPPEPNAMLISDKPARIQICYHSPYAQPIGRIDLGSLSKMGRFVAAIDSVGVQDLTELVGEGAIEVIMNPVQLVGGVYRAVVRVTDPTDAIVLASAQSEPFAVISSHAVPEPGIFLPTTLWEKAPASVTLRKHIS